MAIKSNYREVQAKLKRFDAELAKETRTQLRVLSVEATMAARGLASWSAKIPSAIRPTVTAAGAGVRVSKSVPIAVLNERLGGWRHPLFGNHNDWYHQPSRPSVRPVMDTMGARLGARAEEIVKVAAARAGIR